MTWKDFYEDVCWKISPFLILYCFLNHSLNVEFLLSEMALFLGGFFVFVFFFLVFCCCLGIFFMMIQVKVLTLKFQVSLRHEE